MSKYMEIIRLVDSYRPNSLEDELKLWWLVSLDGKIAVDLMRMDPVTVQEMLDCPYSEALEHSPLIDFPYQELYLHYLQAKICYVEGEYNDYQNAMESYNAAYNEFALWFLNNHDPVQGYPSEEVLR